MRAGSLEQARPARDDDGWVERVRAASDIVELIGQTVSLKRVGRNWVGLCPFHQEKTGSFSVNAERQFYHCFSCKAGGDVFRYVQETEHVGFVEAVELLSRRAGIAVPERRGGGESRVRRPLLDALEAAATAYEQWLGDPNEGQAVRSYLAERGVTPETIRTYRLGLAPNSWDRLAGRLDRRFGAEALIEAGLAARRDSGRGIYDRFRNRLMVPLVAPGGDVVGFGARALDAGQEPKYLNSPESVVYHKRAFVFGYEQARRDAVRPEELILVEGYFDVISMHQAGIRNVVASSGTALTADHARQLKRLVGAVVLTFDGDAAGQDAMLRSLGTVLAAGLDVRVAELPDGEDPDVLIRRRGRPAWESVRAEALDAVEFVQKHGLRRAGPGDARERALHLIVGLAGEIADPVRQRLFLERGAQVFDISERVLARAVGLKRAGQHSEAPVQAAVKAKSRSGAFLEHELLRALLRTPDRIAGARAQLDPEDFQDLACRELAAALWHVAEPETAAAQALARELEATAAEETDWEAIVVGGIHQMVDRKLERRRREVQQRLARVQRERPGETTEIQELLNEYQRLTEQIRALDRAEHVAHGGDVLPPN